jgi:dolichol-phosphate mannosyltransferase
VIVADDNSPDETWRVAEEEGRKRGNVQALRRLHNKGLSPAVMDGLALANGDYAVVMDADLQHDEKIIPQMVQSLRDGKELVIGSRKAPGGGIEDWPWLRRFISWGATFLAKVVMGRSVSDPMSGFFALDMSFFHRAADRVNPRGFKILLEFLNQCAKDKVAEIGFVFRSRQHGESKLSGAVMFEYLVGLFDLRFGRIIPGRFVKFAIVGLSGVFVNQFVLFLSERFIWHEARYSLILAIEVSIIWNYIINNYWTFRDRAKRAFGPFVKGLLFFNAICLAGALINYAVALFLLEQWGMNIYLANLIGIALATFWNFFLNTNITWQEK